MFSAMSSCMTSSVPKCLAKVVFVMSSLVGPSPPVNSTTSASVSARFNASTIACSSSAMASTPTTRHPSSVNRLPIHEALVLTVWPINNSSPMDTIFAFMPKKAAPPWAPLSKVVNRPKSPALSRIIERQVEPRCCAHLGSPPPSTCLKTRPASPRAPAWLWCSMPCAHVRSNPRRERNGFRDGR